MAARGSASTRRSLGRRPLTPGPTSVTTSAAVTPCAVAPPQQPGDLPTQLATLLVGGDSSRVQHRVDPTAVVVAARHLDLDTDHRTLARITTVIQRRTGTRYHPGHT
jgi:hypothetical protein